MQRREFLAALGAGLAASALPGTLQPSSVGWRGMESSRQCGGANPDIVFDAANLQHDRLLNDPQTGWFKSLKGLARILKLRVYGDWR
jgi:hypothetical protein